MGRFTEAFMKNIYLNGDKVYGVTAYEEGFDGWVERYKTAYDCDGREVYIVRESIGEYEREILLGHVEVVYEERNHEGVQ